jgi:hypothetical protein
MTSLPIKFYSHIVVDIPHEYMKIVVGKKGHNFKKACTKLGVDSVWFNMKRNIIEIWGPSQNLPKAYNAINNNISKARRFVPPQELNEYQKTLNIKPDHYYEGSLEGLIEPEDVKYLIGKNGKGFKSITRDAGISFMWYREEKHSIQIWGPEENLHKAINIVNSHVDKIKKKCDNKICTNIDTKIN